MKSLLSLGSNRGDRVANLLLACDELRSFGEIVAYAPLYETSPVGDVPQDDFVNTALVFESSLMPIALLNAIHSVEASLGRTREIHWGPRTIDVDIIDIEGFISDSDELHIPHRFAHVRKFVLKPVSDVAPEWMIAGDRVSTLLECLNSDDEVRPLRDARWEVKL